MKFLWLAVLYTALSLGANAQGAGAADLDALRLGDMKKLVLHAEPRPVPDAAFTNPEGGAHSLADHAGRVLLVNFWATWCAPCRKEMPALDALEAALGGADFAVLPIATGRNPVPAITKFFDETGVTRLPVLLDPEMRLSRQMAVLGLPVTVLIGRDGQEIGRLTGEADWSAPEARALLDAVLAD